MISRDRPAHAASRLVPAVPAVPTVLITQCLQRDFTDPIGPDDRPPNLLHASYSQAVRRGRRIALKEIGNSTDQSDLRADNRTTHAANKGKYSAICLAADRLWRSSRFT